VVLVTGLVSVVREYQTFY